ncbi:3-methyl-2-oxobutanoate hydroxymethyltransferase [Bacillus chungangensis]|uniref:3-methyl-2-oxobutanoate hydroxymethyltransferase n=1 Tax=Bacillus chungangensis TaxID=587633 RepID=A0ABT9WTT9_9BACI|nr:3-methyl-2-oxobutanoate hydroxymethyltransferase [Bacillus chungangensis]MDQ0176175.1 3-methyl-2-oxobutanoate hydroxymethyltransferase [Bacillus chungangensis]
MKQTTDFIHMKTAGEKIAMLTAYDYPTAKLAEQAGVDMILVGDSLGMVVLGYESTIPVTIDDMIHHTKAVKRGAKDTFIVTDMPFMTYHLSREQTLEAAVKLMQIGGAHAVKVEGGGEVNKMIKALTTAGVPVVGHLGLTPQSVGVLGGYKVQGKTTAAAQALIDDALQCQEAGAFALVLECVPWQLAEQVRKIVKIPTIGIGAGAGTDGQVLVFHDVVSYGVERVPKFVKQYAQVNDEIKKGISQYVQDVKNGEFPQQQHTFTMKTEELQALYGGV